MIVNRLLKRRFLVCLASVCNSSRYCIEYGRRINYVNMACVKIFSDEKPNCVFHRKMCTDADKIMDLAKYEEISDETLESLAEYFEELLSAENQYPDADVSLSSGVLTVHLGGKHGTYVINRQTPNRQIWLSSPFSGPKRYDWITNHWIYKRDSESLHQLLSREMSELLKRNVDFSKCSYGKSK